MTTEVYSNDAATSLVNAIVPSDTVITVASSQEFATVGAGGQFRIRIDDEIMIVTGVSGNNWTVTRAAEVCEGAQVAAGHGKYAAVYGVLTVGSLLIGFSSGGGSGTVTSVSIVAANGVSGTVANPTTTPAITIILGAITPSSVAATGTVTGSNLSGTNTGDQTITLTGAVTGSGTGSFVTAISAHSVSYANIQTESAFTLLGNPTGATANVSEITLGSGLMFSGTTLTATGSGGTVTSVALTAPAIFNVGGSPVTGSGTLTLTLATEAANTVWAGPASGGPATPAFRVLVTADMPAGTGTVTSINVSGGTTGLTTSGGPITTSGTITIAGILIAANGGLGADTSGYTLGQIPIAQGAGVYLPDDRRGLYVGTGPPAAGLGYPGDYYIDNSVVPNNLYLKS